MKSFIISLAVILTLASCSRTSSVCKREVISPEAPLNMPFRSDTSTLRAYNELSNSNPINALNRNTARCKAMIAVTILNSIEDCAIRHIDDYPTQRALIEHLSNEIIKESLNDAVVTYDKTTLSDKNIYTSMIMVELKKENLLEQIKASFIEKDLIPAADADAFVNAVNEAMTPKY